MHTEDFRRPHKPAEVIMQTLYDFDQGKNLLHNVQNTQDCDSFVITWMRPAEGWFKLNCDGALNRVTSSAGYGGLIRGQMVNGLWAFPDFWVSRS